MVDQIMGDLIHIFHSNQQNGPFTVDQINQMIDNGSITAITLAWKMGMSDWAPLNTIPDFDGIGGTPPPPPVCHLLPLPIFPNSSQSACEPKGVGGWLMFYCVVLTILAPLSSLGYMAINWERAQSLFYQFPALKHDVIWEYFGIVVNLIYGFIVGCPIWLGNAKGRKIAQEYLTTRLTISITITILAMMQFNPLPSEWLPAAIGTGIGETIYFLILWFYFKRSRRVHNTYGPV